MERKFLASAFIDAWREINNAFNIMQAEDTDSEDENVVVLHTIVKVNEEPHRIKNYIEETVANYTEREFQSHFRLKLTTYEELERMLGPQLSPEIDPRKQLLSVLWLLATPDSFRSVGDRFDVAKSSLESYFTMVVKELNKIAQAVIMWPNDNEKIEAELAFASFGGLRGCIGAVDGAFVEIKAPKEHAHVFICRKSFYSIQLQAIALPNLKITDAFAGYPGSVGDRRIFVNSPIYKNFQSNPSLYFRDNQYILGDKAYPVLNWCIPPFIDRGDMTPEKIHFNTQHAKTRQVIERTFALLFGRFRRLKYLNMNKVEFIPNTILACCVLHNLCLKDDTNDTLEEMIADGQAFLRSQRLRMGPDEDDSALVYNINDGHRRRQTLMTMLNSAH